MLLAVEIVWLLTLAAVVLGVTPLVLYRCWRLVHAARDVNRHFGVTLAAAKGVAAHTAAIPALADTIGVAGQMLESAASIERTSAAIVGLLVGRMAARPGERPAPEPG